MVNIILFLVNFFMDTYKEKNGGEKSQPTQQMLKEHCECEDDNRITIGKKRPSVMIVDAFEKPENTYQSKQLKPKDVF